MNTPITLRSLASALLAAKSAEASKYLTTSPAKPSVKIEEVK